MLGTLHTAVNECYNQISHHSAKYLPWMSLQHQLIFISHSLHLLKHLYRMPCAVYWMRKQLYTNLYYSIQSNFSLHDSSFPPLSIFYIVYQKCSNNITCLYVKTNVTCIEFNAFLGGCYLEASYPCRLIQQQNFQNCYRKQNRRSHKVFHTTGYPLYKPSNTAAW